MPKLTDAIATRLEQLLSKPPECVYRPSGTFEDSEGVVYGRGWCVSAAALIAAVVSDSEHPYRTVASTSLKLNNVITACEILFGQLNQLQSDFEAGLLSTVENRVSAETFDDLLDHAEAYLQDKRHQPAGVLAGVVFEDTIRRLSAKHGIDPAGRELDNLLNALKSKGVLTKLEQKEGVAAAEVRAKATHADWDAFNAEQVEATAKFARRLIRDKLAS